MLKRKLKKNNYKKLKELVEKQAQLIRQHIETIEDLQYQIKALNENKQDQEKEYMIFD